MKKKTLSAREIKDLNRHKIQQKKIRASVFSKKSLIVQKRIPRDISLISKACILINVSLYFNIF